MRGLAIFAERITTRRCRLLKLLAQELIALATVLMADELCNTAGVVRAMKILDESENGGSEMWKTCEYTYGIAGY